MAASDPIWREEQDVEEVTVEESTSKEAEWVTAVFDLEHEEKGEAAAPLHRIRNSIVSRMAASTSSSSIRRRCDLATSNRCATRSSLASCRCSSQWMMFERPAMWPMRMRC